MVKSKSSLKARATPSPLITSTVIALPSAPAPTSGAAAIAATAAMAMRIGASTWERISRAGRSSPFCTWSSGSDGGSGVPTSSPCARASRRARTTGAWAAVRYASRPCSAPRPADTTRTSARPRNRPESGEITSTAWIRASGMRSDWRRMNPVSICRLPSAILHRVTSHEMKPPSPPRTSRAA